MESAEPGRWESLDSSIQRLEEAIESLAEAGTEAKTKVSQLESACDQVETLKPDVWQALARLEEARSRFVAEIRRLRLEIPSKWVGYSLKRPGAWAMESIRKLRNFL